MQKNATMFKQLFTDVVIMAAADMIMLQSFCAALLLKRKVQSGKLLAYC